MKEERNTMMENLLGKEEEFVFKADAFEEAAKKGAEGSPPIDPRWNPGACNTANTPLNTLNRMSQILL
jgi:hypothetical protein